MSEPTPELDLTGRWNIDPQHSRIGFSTRHAMVTKIRGAFNEFEGEALYDPDQPDASEVKIVVQMSSVDTRSAQRDDHLRGEDFFNVEAFPTMTFVSDKIDQVDDEEFVVVGDLTIRDMTRQISIPLALVGVHGDQFGQVRAGFEGSRRINRKDWGVTWNTALDGGGVIISDKISLEFELSLIKQSDEAVPGPVGA
ncbi:MAG: YceI family protein [Galactobacter sp.]